MKIKLFSKKISINILITAVFCFFLSIYLSLVFMQYVSLNILHGVYRNTLYCNSILISIVILGIVIFVSVFLLIINKRIKYLKHITKEVKKIADEEFGSKIEVIGNDELAQLCTSINSMSFQLKNKFDNERKFENIKNELITNMSHDLRSPLTSIIGYMDLIRKREYKDVSQFDEFTEVMSNKCQELKRLINELFEYTKLTSEGIQLNLNNVNISELLTQLTGEYIPVFEAEGLSINYNVPEEDIIVNVDIEKIVRVFDNILINAKKYSSKHSEVVVELYKNETSVVVSISNKVNNMPIDDLEKLFERFYIVDKSRGYEGGTGLGLAIAKRIVELHRGKIWAEYKDNIIKFNVELVV